MALKQKALISVGYTKYKPTLVLRHQAREFHFTPYGNIIGIGELVVKYHIPCHFFLAIYLHAQTNNTISRFHFMFF